MGLFQQNPVDYTMYPRTEPGGAAWMFYDRLLKLVPGYDTDPRTDYEIGDVVQLTGTGERFGQYQDMARELAGQLVDNVSLAQDDVTCVPAPASPATTSGSGFDAGNIISDAVFYNTGAMTVEQIRQFVLTQGEGCTGAYCLKNLRVSTPSQPADRYCAAYQGGTNEDVAAILLRVSVACGINPQVMLVTLQKESALLSRTDVSASTYNAAWGWHCPDTGPGGSANCDPAYAGFFNQAYGMAKQWSRYKLDPEKYNYHAGQTVNILWNVAESGCGSAPVTIANQATASLYIYTPYQPNQASLAAYPGVGDACSAYGNRNFFYLFRKYFGSTGGGTSTTATSAVLATGTAVKIPANQFVSAALGGQTITAPNAAVAAGLAAGFSALGLPYVWGGGGSGAGPNNGCARGGGEYNSCGATIGFDCSGLTAFVLGKAGYRIPDNSGSQRSAGVTVSWAQALPGDVVGFPGHVAIYLGTFGGRPYILEASWVGTPIHIVPLTRTDVDDRLYRYWTGPAAGAPGSRGLLLADPGPAGLGLRIPAAHSGVPWVSLTPRSSSGTPARTAPANPPSHRSVTWVPQIVPRPVPAPVDSAAGDPPPVTPPPVTEPGLPSTVPATSTAEPTPAPTTTAPPTTTRAADDHSADVFCAGQHDLAGDDNEGFADDQDDQQYAGGVQRGGRDHPTRAAHRGEGERHADDQDDQQYAGGVQHGDRDHHTRAAHRGEGERHADDQDDQQYAGGVQRGDDNYSGGERRRSREVRRCAGHPDVRADDTHTVEPDDHRRAGDRVHAAADHPDTHVINVGRAAAWKFGPPPRRGAIAVRADTSG